MRHGIHRTGDFGYNGMNADMDGFFDDAIDWVKTNVTGGKTTAMVATEAAAENQKKMLMYGAVLIAFIGLAIYLMKKK